MGPARSCEGACAPPMCRCNASSSVRLCGPPGGSVQMHAATCGGHRVSFPAEVAGVCEVGGRRPRAEMAEPEVVPPLSEGVPDL